MIEPGTGVVQVPCGRADQKCDGNGCAKKAAEYVE
jgi:hypothetical protein